MNWSNGRRHNGLAIVVNEPMPYYYDVGLNKHLTYGQRTIGETLYLYNA
jgi:hypothetical protein